MLARTVWQHCPPEFDGSAAAISWFSSFFGVPHLHFSRMAKNSLRDKLEGDELDLSMMSFTEVPVKEIVSERPSLRGFMYIYVHRFVTRFISKPVFIRYSQPGVGCFHMHRTPMYEAGSTWDAAW